MEKSEFEPTESSGEKFQRMLWTDSEAKLVGEFLSGNPPFPVQTTPETQTSWKNLSKGTNFGNEENSFLISEGSSLLKSLGIGNPQPDNLDTDQPSKEEYRFSALERSRIVQVVVVGAIKKSGIGTNDNMARVMTRSSFRKDDSKGNFSQDNYFGEDIKNKGYIGNQEGGPQALTAIFPPQYSEERNLSDERIRGSLAHEAQHVVRAFTNSQLWQGFEDQATEAGLERPKANEIGGFKVASNLQGSEANGELFSQIVSFRAKEGKDATISQMKVVIADGLEKAVLKTEVRPRYLSAKIALLHHLNQLDKLGFGNLPAERLVALASFGYASLEKLPELIKLGVIDQDKFNKINYVILNMESWLTSKAENGFKLN